MVASVASDFLGAPGIGMVASLATCGAIYLFFGIMASMGGVLGIMRRKWELVVVGAVFSMLSVGTLLLSSILGLVGLIPAALSRGDFDQRPGGPGGKKVFTVPAASAPSVP